MKSLIGIILMLLGIVTGLYVGLWLMFVGGIIDVVDFFKQSLEPMGLLAWGVVKVVCASFVGWLSALIFIVPGWGFIIKGIYN